MRMNTTLLWNSVQQVFTKRLAFSPVFTKRKLSKCEGSFLKKYYPQTDAFSLMESGRCRQGQVPQIIPTVHSSALLNALFLYPYSHLDFLRLCGHHTERMSIVQVPPFTDEGAQAASLTLSHGCLVPTCLSYRLGKGKKWTTKEVETQIGG